MTLTELRATRLLYSKYDDNLNGRMHVTNSKSFLAVWLNYYYYIFAYFERSLFTSFWDVNL